MKFCSWFYSDSRSNTSIHQKSDIIKTIIGRIYTQCGEYICSINRRLTMDTSVKTVDAQITKALKQIRKFLGERYYYLF